MKAEQMNTMFSRKKYLAREHCVQEVSSTISLLVRIKQHKAFLKEKMKRKKLHPDGDSET